MSATQRRAELAWRSALALACAAAAVASATGCSQSQCKDMKGSGSALAGVFCGGAGDDAAEPAVQPAVCSEPHQVMPAFFALLADPARPLGGLRLAVAALGASACLDPIANRRCTVGDGDHPCEFGDCAPDPASPAQGLCPCINGTNPLGDLLVVTFRGLAAVADPNKPAEPGAVAPSHCAADPSVLTDATRNQLCEVRRTLNFLLDKGGARLFDDPAVVATIKALLDYVQGIGYAGAHYDLFTTLGKMAANPGICQPATAYDVLDKALLYLTPARASNLVGDLQTLLADPQTKVLLGNISTSGGATGRASVITIAKSLLPGLIAAKDGEDALSAIDNLAQQLVYGSTNYSAAFKSEVQAVLGDVHAILCGGKAACGGLDTGIFPDAQLLLKCLSSPGVDPDATLVGALYDLLSLKPLAAGAPGVDLPTLLGAVKLVIDLDPSGQTVRLLRFIIASLEGNEQATEAVRGLLAEALTPEVGKNLVPALSVLVEKKVLGEVLALLQEILSSCGKSPLP